MPTLYQNGATFLSLIADRPNEKTRSSKAWFEPITGLAQEPSSRTLYEIQPLTSLRFFAVLLIIWLHISPVFGLASAASLTMSNCGFDQALSLLFVLSGFVNTYIYRNGFKSLAESGRYLFARIARLWPAHAVVLSMLVLSVPSNFWHANRTDFPLIFFVNLGLLQCCATSSRYYSSLNLPAWSLSTEFAFYLLFPFLIANFRSNWFWKLSAALACAVSSIMLASFCYSMPANIQFMRVATWLLLVNPLARVFEFVLGMSICLAFIRGGNHFRNKRLLATVLEALAIAVLLGSFMLAPHIFGFANAKSPPFIHASAFWLTFCGGSVAAAFLIYMLACETGLVSRLLRASYLVELGRISYCMFLVHYTIMLWFSCYVMPLPKMEPLPRCFFYFLVVLVSARYLYNYVEVPGRSWLKIQADNLLFRRSQSTILDDRQVAIADSMESVSAR